MCFVVVEGGLQDLYQTQEILLWLLFRGCNMIESMIGINCINFNQGYLQFFFCDSTFEKSKNNGSIPFILFHVTSF